MRHWFRNRAALTRPNFGTAISMSNTFAVETYSGGSCRICSIRTRPSLRSFFNRAFMGCRERFARVVVPELPRLARELFAHSGGRVWVREERRPERDVRRPGGDQLEGVASRRDPSHPDDLEARRAEAREDGGE